MEIAARHMDDKEQSILTVYEGNLFHFSAEPDVSKWFAEIDGDLFVFKIVISDERKSGVRELGEKEDTQ